LRILFSLQDKAGVEEGYVAWRETRSELVDAVGEKECQYEALDSVNLEWFQ
jgi:hypothetical protein